MFNSLLKDIVKLQWRFKNKYWKGVLKYHMLNIASLLKYLKGVRTRSGNDLKKTEASEISDEELHSEMYAKVLIIVLMC